MGKQKKLVQAVAYLRTSSSTNIGPDKDSDKRQRAAIAADHGAFLCRGVAGFEMGGAQSRYLSPAERVHRAVSPCLDRDSQRLAAISGSCFDRVAPTRRRYTRDRARRCRSAAGSFATEAMRFGFSMSVPPLSHASVRFRDAAPGENDTTLSVGVGALSGAGSVKGSLMLGSTGISGAFTPTPHECR